MKTLRYTFKTDILFKMLFVQHPDLLKGLVAALLGISIENIEQFIIRNPDIPPETLNGKFCRLDISMTVNGQLVDLEVQVSNEGDFPDRAVYYWARGFSSTLPAGQGYATLPRVITISIVDFKLFDCPEYHSFFQLLEVTRHTLLTDKMGFHFFELPKLPTDVDENNMLLLWLSLFKANTEEELTKIKAMEVPVMSQAIDAYYTITASSRFQEIERLRDKASHDEAQALYHATQVGMQKGRQEGRQEGLQEGLSRRNAEVVRNALKLHLPVDTIRQLTDLSEAEIEELGRQL